MNKMCSILLLLVNFLTFQAEAKIYTNKEYSYSVWLPDGTEYAYEAPANSDEPIKFRAEYQGLNFSVMAAHTPNVRGQDFNDLAITRDYLETCRQGAVAFGSEFYGYYNCPNENHYYAIAVRKQPNHVSVTLFTEIHCNFIELNANGPAKYENIAREIMDSFKCLRE